MSRLCWAATGRSPSDPSCMCTPCLRPSRPLGPLHRTGTARSRPRRPVSPRPPAGGTEPQCSRPLGPGQHRSGEAVCPGLAPKVPGSFPLRPLAWLPSATMTMKRSALEKGRFCLRSQAFICVCQLRSCQKMFQTLVRSTGGSQRAVAVRRLGLKWPSAGQTLRVEPASCRRTFGDVIPHHGPRRPPGPLDYSSRRQLHGPVLTRHRAAACGLGRWVEGREPQLSGGASGASGDAPDRGWCAWHIAPHGPRHAGHRRPRPELRGAASL